MWFHFQVIDVKRFIFSPICWPINSFYRLSTKFKKKYPLFQIDNLKSNLKISFIPSPPHTKRNHLYKTWPIIKVSAAIAILKWLVIYYYHTYIINVFFNLMFMSYNKKKNLPVPATTNKTLKTFFTKASWSLICIKIVKILIVFMSCYIFMVPYSNSLQMQLYFEFLNFPLQIE